MIDDWMPALQSGNFDEWLHDLTIVRPGEDPVEGYGRMRWTIDGLIEIEAFSVIKDFFTAFGSSFLPGIVPRREHYMLNARTEDGWEVEVPHIVTFPAQRMTEGLSHWEFKSPTLILKRRTGMKDRSLRALLGPIQRLFFPRFSTTTDDNPQFGGKRGRRDWTRYEPSFGAVVLRKSGVDHALVDIEADLDRPGLTQALYAVQTSLSFVEGRNVSLVGYESLCDGEHHRNISKNAGTTKASFSPPLGWMADPRFNYEYLLTLATNFFFTTRGRIYSDQLRMCWAIADSYGSQKAMAACGAVEKLVKHSHGDFTPPVVEEEEKARNVIKRFLEKHRDRLDERFRNRISGFLNKMKTADSKDILRKWIAEGFLGLEQEDLKAWDTLRHPVAHGELIFNFKEEEFAELETMFCTLKRVENLINKIVLFEMGYRGTYYNHNLYLHEKFDHGRDQ